MTRLTLSPAAMPATPYVTVHSLVFVDVKKSTCTPLGAPKVTEPYADEPTVKAATALLPSVAAVQPATVGLLRRHGTVHAWTELDAVVADSTNSPMDPKAFA
jgi:hypothetical protein